MKPDKCAETAAASYSPNLNLVTLLGTSPNLGSSYRHTRWELHVCLLLIFKTVYIKLYNYYSETANNSGLLNQNFTTYLGTWI